MSVYFSLADGTTLWNPGNLTGWDFMDRIRAAEKVLGVASGVGPFEPDDDAIVDTSALSRFVSVLDAHRDASHPSTLTILVVLLLNAEVPPNVGADVLSAAELAKGNPRSVLD